MDPVRLMTSAALSVALGTLFAPPVLGLIQAPAPRTQAHARLDVSVIETARIAPAQARAKAALCLPEPGESAGRLKGAPVFAQMDEGPGTMSGISR